jgi:predicted glycosyltransferase
MLLPDQSANPTVMSGALKRLPQRLPPSKNGGTLQLKGLDHISQTVGHWLDGRSSHLSVVGAE